MEPSSSPSLLPENPSPALVWQAAERAVIAGDASALERLLRDHPQILRRMMPPPYVPSGPGPRYADEARAIVAAEQRFESFEQFEAHRAAMARPDSPVARFEAAVEAVISGDEATLQRLLREDPDLVRARSPRTHHATLLIYVGANGVEGFRQKTPKNAVRIAEILLDAGAELDAGGDMYGGTTTLGLVATSIHPELAGVQNDLLAFLLDRGAGQGQAVAPTYTNGRLINACLANGRPGAAEFLAAHGADLDLEGAAGIGRLDLVERWFDADGRLKAPATEAELADAFAWACEYGRTPVVEFLLQHGMRLDARLRHHGQTGLHWAAFGAHVDTVALLLQLGAPIDVKDSEFRGTPLDWALYAWGTSPDPDGQDRPDRQNRQHRFQQVVTRLVAAGARLDVAWLADPDRGSPIVEKLRADPAMRAALGDQAAAL